MKVEYLPSFLKDLKALKSTPVFEQVKDFAFAEIPNSNDLQTIVNLKKLKGSAIALSSIHLYFWLKKCDRPLPNKIQTRQRHPPILTNQWQIQV